LRISDLHLTGVKNEERELGGACNDTSLLACFFYPLLAVFVFKQSLYVISFKFLSIARVHGFQIAVEADELFSGVLTDLGEVVDYNPDGEDPILTIFDYVEAMRCQLWEIAFFVELGGDNGAHKNNPPDKQPFFVQAVRRVLYRYFRYVLLPRKAISKVPAFFPNYLDIDNPDSMFTPAIKKTWDSIHFQQCGWYLDCPFKKPPPFDIALRDSIQPLVPSPAGSIPGIDSPTPLKGGSARSKTATKGSKPRGSKRKAAELDEEAMDEDIRATDVPPSELPDPISSHPPRAPSAKRIHLAGAVEAKSITFVPPAVKAMSSSQAGTSSVGSPRILILNDSFHRMLDYKAKHSKFPSTYDDMVSFLSEVHIHLLFHSIWFEIRNFSYT
jgi:hypothetical protein